MKKLAWMAALSLLCAVILPVWAVAQESAVQETYFALGNGITWNSTQADIIAVAGEPNPEYSGDSDGFQLLYYEEQTVGPEQTGDLALMLFDDELLMAVYNLYDTKTADYAYFENTFTAAYGQPTTPDIQRFLDVMSVFGLTATYEEYLQAAQGISFANWELDDGSYAVLFREGDAFFIAYVNEARIVSLSAADGD